MSGYTLPSQDPTYGISLDMLSLLLHLVNTDPQLAPSQIDEKVNHHTS